jgi:hypothetical protein
MNRFLLWWKQRRCRHRVYYQDLHRVNANKVEADCHVCGKHLEAICGLWLPAKLENRPTMVSTGDLAAALGDLAAALAIQYSLQLVREKLQDFSKKV